MLRFANVATPFTGVTVFVPESVPPPGFVPRGGGRSVQKAATVVPASSLAASCTAGEIVLPALVLLGWTVNTRWVAGRGVMLNGELVAPVRPVAVATSV